MRALLALSLLTGCNAVLGLDTVTVVDAGLDAYVPDHAVAYLPLDNSSTIGTPDNAGGDASCTECPAVTAGKVDRAMSFTETNQVFRLEQRASLETTTGFTVAFWLKLTELPGMSAYSCAVQKLYGDTGNSWQLCVDAAGGTHYIVETSTGTKDLGGPTLLDKSTWHHYALVWNGDVASLLVDGSVTSAQSSGIDVVFDGGLVTVGADIEQGAPVYAPKGLIDDVRIYDVALSSAQIQALPGM